MYSPGKGNETHLDFNRETMEIKRSVEISVEKTRRFVIRQPETDAIIIVSGVQRADAGGGNGSRFISNQMPSAFIKSLKRARRISLKPKMGAMFVCPPSLDAAIGEPDDAPPVETINLLADAAENQIREIEIRQEVL